MKIVGKLTLMTFNLQIAGVVASFCEVKSVSDMGEYQVYAVLMMGRFPELQEK